MSHWHHGPVFRCKYRKDEHCLLYLLIIDFFTPNEHKFLWTIYQYKAYLCFFLTSLKTGSALQKCVCGGGGGGEKKRMLLSHRKQCTVVVERMPVDHFPFAVHLRGSDRSVPGARGLSQKLSDQVGQWLKGGHKALPAQVQEVEHVMVAYGTIGTHQPRVQVH